MNQLLLWSMLLFFNGTIPSLMPAPVPSPNEDRVRLLDREVLDSLQTNRSGRPLLLNVWATWCVPCVEEFPDLERLHRKYGGSQLDVIVLSIDFPDEVHTKVEPFLRKMKATMPAYINAFDRPLDLIETLDPEWSGAVPATFVYDSNGNPVTMVIGKRSLDQFERLVTSVITDGNAQNK